MRRRALLATIPTLAALPGCNARNPGDSPEDDGTLSTTTATTDPTTSGTTTTEPTTETTTPESTTQSTTETTTTTVRNPEYPRFVELASIDGTDYSGLTFDATVDSRRIDSTETAAILAILQNTGDTTLELEMGYRPPFSKVRCDGGGYLLVKPSKDGDLDACWEPPRLVGQPQPLTKTELPPGEVLTTAMTLWGDPRTDACLPTGTFRFVSDFRVTRDGETEGRANAFTIRVTTG